MLVETDKFPVWAVVDGDNYDERLATPHSNGTVTIMENKIWTREKWEEFKEQVDELFDVAERKDPA